MRRVAACLPLLLASVSVLAQPGSGAPGPDGFVAWADETVVRLDSLDPGDADPADFAFLDKALEGKRIVYLGETDHFVAERMEFRLVMIRELMKRGYRRIGMEMGLSDAKRMDRYLETGDEAWLDRVALYGYRGDMREDRDDEVPGWTDDRHPEFTRVVLDEAEWFVRQLRAINERLPEGEPRLRWFGYDLSFRPGGGYADADELLAPHAGNPLVDEIRRRMERVPGESRIEEAERLEALVAMLDGRREELVSLLGERGALDLRRSLQRMGDAFRFIDQLQGLDNFDAEAVRRALVVREQRMKHNFEEHLAEWPADEKIILLGHALHLSKDSESIDTRTFGRMWESIGTSLNRRLPGQVYGVWLLHDRGMHGVARGEPTVRRLARVCPILILPLGSGDPREAWLDAERVFSYSGEPARAVLARQVDCLFFVGEAHEPGVRVGDR